jgi:hypothetical protein
MSQRFPALEEPFSVLNLPKELRLEVHGHIVSALRHSSTPVRLVLPEDIAPVNSTCNFIRAEAARYSFILLRASFPALDSQRTNFANNGGALHHLM